MLNAILFSTLFPIVLENHNINSDAINIRLFSTVSPIVLGKFSINRVIIDKTNSMLLIINIRLKSTLVLHKYGRAS